MGTGRRRDRHSIERYHRGLDALADINEQRAGSHYESEPTTRAKPPVAPVTPDRSPRTTAPLAKSDDPETGKKRPAHVSDDSFATRALGPDAPASSPFLPAPARSAFATIGSHWQRLAVGALVVVVGGILIGIAASGSTPSSPRHAVSTTTPRPRNSASSSSPSTKLATPAAVPSTTAAPRVSAEGRAAKLLSISPDTAAPGQTLTIAGSGFESPNGKIVVMFGSAPAPTNCPSEERCFVTVPVETHREVLVRVQTEYGLSNGVSFHYR